jgi:hypothetical protein
MKGSADGFEAAITSPPYEASVNNPNDPQRNFDKAVESGHTRESMGNPGGQLRYKFQYSDSNDQLGTQCGEDFWSAARLIVEQVYQVLVPNGHACFVVKDFVRNKKRVEFTRQWAELCEAVGFRLIHHHRAMLVEEIGAQPALYADDLARHVAGRVERKSFFRRLAEQKGSPRIDWESVLCFEK